jgi:phage protein|nr:MAG TPA: IrrE protein [Caudoviricetes sp.]
MSIEDICKKYGVKIEYFDKDLWNRNGIYIDEIKVVFVSKDLAPEKQKQVILHELGHLEHTKEEYHNAILRCENEANRNMIHHLLVDALGKLDDPYEFNYLNFMEYYNLKTTTEEVMVKEEYQALLNFNKGQFYEEDNNIDDATTSDFLSSCV